MADEKAASPLLGATDRIRETAKWMTISLAAIGGVLAAGSQLSDIGSLPIYSARFWAAIGGGAAATVGILLILLAAVWTATTPALTLRGLASQRPKAAYDWFTNNQQLLLGWGTLQQLSDAYDSRRKAKNDAYEQYLSANDQNRAAKKTESDLKDAAFSVVSDDATTVLQVAQFENVAHRWRITRIWLVLGGLLAAAGIGLFAWASNPPADAVASSARPNVLTAPKTRTLTLTPEGQTALKSQLKCDQTEIPVLLLAETAAGPDVLVQASSCASIRILVGATWGTVKE